MEPSPKKLSAQTKSFIILFTVALVGTYACLEIIQHSSLPYAWSLMPSSEYHTTTYKLPNQNIAKVVNLDFPPPPPVDTTNWKTYTDPNYHFSFLYSPSWKVKPFQEGTNFNVMEIDPGPKYYNMKVLVSPNQYFAMIGLPAHSDTIDDMPALNVENYVFGIQHNGYYFTFDVGYSLSLTPAFNTMVKSLKFTN